MIGTHTGLRSDLGRVLGRARNVLAREAAEIFQHREQIRVFGCGHCARIDYLVIADAPRRNG